MQFKEIQSLSELDMEGVNQHIRDQLYSDVVLIRQIGARLWLSRTSTHFHCGGD
jgi:hypothetical protein